MFHISDLKLYFLLLVSHSNIFSQDSTVINLLDKKYNLLNQKEVLINHHGDTLRKNYLQNRKGDEIHLFYSCENIQQNFIMYKIYNREMFAFVGNVKGNIFFVSNIYLLVDDVPKEVRGERELPLFFELEWFFADKTFFKKFLKKISKTISK